MVDFSSKAGTNAQGFSVHYADRTLSMDFPGGKGVVSWDDVRAFVFHQTDETQGTFSMEFLKPLWLLSEKSYKYVSLSQ